MATDAQRAHMVALMDFMHRHASQLDYPPGDVRTWRDGSSWHLTEQQAKHLLESGGRMQFDCSEYVPWILRCAGCWPYSTPGATSSHLELFRHSIYTDAREAYAGAIVIFGGGGGHHEAIVHTPDRRNGNPLLSSHGRPGLDLVKLRDEAARQPPGVRLISIAHL